MLSVEGVAKYLGISRAQVDKFVELGLLSSITVNLGGRKHLRIPDESVREFIRLGGTKQLAQKRAKAKKPKQVLNTIFHMPQR